MFQQLRKIFNIDTLDDKISKYNQSKEEIDILKSSLDELSVEYNQRSQSYISNKNQLQDRIIKGDKTESEFLLYKVEERFQLYLKDYISQIADIKKSINLEQGILNDLLKVDGLYQSIQINEKINAFNIIKQGFRKGLVNRDIFHKAQLEVEDYIEKSKHIEHIKVHTKHGDYLRKQLINDKENENEKEDRKQNEDVTGISRNLTTSDIYNNTRGCPEEYRGEQRATWQLNKLKEESIKNGFLEKGLEDLKKESISKPLKGTEAEILFKENSHGIIEVLKAIYPLKHLHPTNESLDNFIERIELYNQYFPETFLEFKGVSESPQGDTILFGQNFIEGNILKPKDPPPFESFAAAKVRLKEQDKLFKQVASELKKRYKFELIPGELTKYTDGKVTITDVHLGNVMRGVDGKLYFIDLDILPNEIKKSSTEDLEIEEYLEKSVHIEKVLVHGKTKNYYSNRLKNDNSEQDIFFNKVKDYGQKVFRENDILKRLPQREEFGRLSSGRGNVEITILLGASEGTNGKTESTSKRKSEQEKLVERYAKKNNLWIDSLPEIKPSNKFDEGSEAKIYYYKNSKVLKVNSLKNNDDVLEFLDRIAIHNSIFPETSYIIEGFGKFDSKFSVILTQELFKNKNKVDSGQDIINDMTKREFEFIPANKFTMKSSFVSDDYIISDIYGNKKNTLQGDNVIFYIDPLITVNTKDKGMGGKLVLGEINIPDDKIQKSQGDWLNRKVKYADSIIRNNEGQILFLKRNNNSDFEPGKLCLPGGHVDLGESFTEAAIRECQEEVSLKITQAYLIHIFEDDRVRIEYYECFIDSKEWNPFNDIPQIILDNNEHINYIWLDKDEWQDKDLLCNLKEQLNDIFINNIEKNTIEILLKNEEDDLNKASLIILIKAFQLGNLSQDVLEKALSQYGQSKHKDKVKVTRGGKTFYREQTVGGGKQDESEQQVKEPEVDYDKIKKFASEAEDSKLGEYIAGNGDLKIKEIARKQLLERGKKHIIVNDSVYYLTDKEYKNQQERYNTKDQPEKVEDKKERADGMEVERPKGDDDYKLENKNKEDSKPEDKKNPYEEKFKHLSDNQLEMYLDAPHQEVKEAAKKELENRGKDTSEVDLTGETHDVINKLSEKHKEEPGKIQRQYEKHMSSKYGEGNHILDKDTLEAHKILNKNDIKLDSSDFYQETSKLDDKEFNKVAKLRFNTIIKTVDLDGEWGGKQKDILQHFENFALKTLPKGHIVNNASLKSFENHNYKSNPSYALYNRVSKKISLSDKMTEKTQIKGNLDIEHEFKAVMSHEIGHAVSDKLKEIDLDKYKNFSKLCGWDDEGSLKNATGDQSKIERKDGGELITPYAEVSSSEAFSEYYSIYALNKDAIDSMIKEDFPFNLKYRGQDITSDQMDKNMKIFKFMKDDVWDNDELSKALLQDDIEKSHKYIKRTGVKGDYKYLYNENTEYNGDTNKQQRKIERLSQAEEQGSMLGGRTNVEATILIRAIKGTNKDSFRDQELKLINDFKNKGLIFKTNNPIFKDFIGNGIESKVYKLNDNEVVKRLDVAVRHDDLNDFMDRIAIHNLLFPETKYELLGLTTADEDSFSNINFVLKQNLIKNSTPATSKDIEDDMQKRGFNKVNTTTYQNKDYTLTDLRGANVFKDNEDNLFYIDPVISVNKNNNIKDHAKRIIEGKEQLERLSPSEEQGRNKGGQRNVEATILLSTSERTGSENQGEGLARGEQIDILKKSGEISILERIKKWL